MFLLYGNQLGNQFVKDLAAQAARKRSIDRQTWNYYRNIGRAFRRGLIRNIWLGIGLKVRRMVRRFVGVLQLRLGSVNLKKMASEISFIRNFRANHLGSNLRAGAEAQFVHHAIQTHRQ